MNYIKMNILIRPLIFLSLCGCATIPKERPSLKKPILVKVLKVNRLCFEEDQINILMDYIEDLEANQRE